MLQLKLKGRRTIKVRVRCQRSKQIRVRPQVRRISIQTEKDQTRDKVEFTTAESEAESDIGSETEKKRNRKQLFDKEQKLIEQTQIVYKTEQPDYGDEHHSSYIENERFRLLHFK